MGYSITQNGNNVLTHTTEWSYIMARKIEVMEASDGKIFKYKNAAKRYERGLILGERIKELPVDAASKKCIANNWEEIRKMVRNAGNVLPNEDVPDREGLNTK